MSDAALSCPKPENFEAMAAAHADPVAFAREVFRYDEQLQAGGYPSTEETKRRWHGRDG